MKLKIGIDSKKTITIRIILKAVVHGGHGSDGKDEIELQAGVGGDVGEDSGDDDTAGVILTEGLADGACRAEIFFRHFLRDKSAIHLGKRGGGVALDEGIGEEAEEIAVCVQDSFFFEAIGADGENVGLQGDTHHAADLGKLIFQKGGQTDRGKRCMLAVEIGNKAGCLCGRCVKTVVAVFVLDPEEDEDTAAHAYGQAADGEGAVYFSADDVAPGGEEIVSEHAFSFGIQQDGS